MAEESSSSSVVSTVNSRSFHIRQGLSSQDRGPRARGIFSLTDTEEDVQFDSESTAILWQPLSFMSVVMSRIWVYKPSIKVIYSFCMLMTLNIMWTICQSSMSK